MPRRTCFSFDVFWSCCVATCIRKPNCSFSSASSSVLSAAGDLSASAFFESVNFSVAPLTQQPLDERRLNRQLGGRKRERLPCQRLVDAVHLVEHFAGLNLADVILRVALAVAHADLGRLLRHRLVRKNADPDAAAALDVARHRAPRRLDLPRRESSATDGLQAVFAEAHLVADGRNALVAALLLLAIFPSSWLQHSSLLLPTGAAAWALRAPARVQPSAPRCAPALRP